MREIKFRAWNKSTGYMILPVSLEGLVTCQEILLGWQGRDNELEYMQYTGLKDKNRVEIYEGDKLGGTWAEGYIQWCDKCKSFEFFMDEFGCSWCSRDISWEEVVDNKNFLEVIGNIYENPEEGK